MKPWYTVVKLRKEVREGRSFSPDEFAIALEQVVSGSAPQDYSDPIQFFSRTCFTNSLQDHILKVLSRICGRTANTSPVLTLITKFGGGKTHILTSLYHIAKNSSSVSNLPGVSDLLKEAKITSLPDVRVGVFVGNAWDPEEGRENPWIDLARQVAGDQGVEALGSTALTVPPGTEALSKVFQAAGAPVLFLFDEVLNFINRHSEMAESFHAFIQNLSVATTGTARAVAVISLPRSQVEMTPTDQEWQEKITKVVRRVSRDLFANDESEISEVICRRLFEDRGSPKERKKIARVYADWCFERTDRLPREWTSADTALKHIKAKEFLADRFEACYPFHPATLSVFQRKWQALSQFQQTRGSLAMLAQWISAISLKQYKYAYNAPLITLGSAPLDIPEFRAVVLGQLGENRLDTAIDADIAGRNAHARTLDAGVPTDLQGIHRRVGTAILFESSGGQVNKVASLPELYFALGAPSIDTSAIENAAVALERKGFFTRRVGSDYKIHYQATLKKVVSDRRASLNEEKDTKPAIRELVENEFRRGKTLRVVPFPDSSSIVQDTPELILVILDPETEWSEEGQVTQHIIEWTRDRGHSPRLYPGSLVWCVKSAGLKLREKVELWLAWQMVEQELSRGDLGPEFDNRERSNISSYVREAEEAAKNEVWASYRYVVLSDPKEQSGIRNIDLGAGYSSSVETLCGRVITALKSEGLLNETVSAGYIDRKWPNAFTDDGAWPLTGLRKNFLDGSLTRLADPEKTLREQIRKFVETGEFGLASGLKANGKYQRVRYNQAISQEEIEFDQDVYLLKSDKARSLLDEPAGKEDPQPSIQPDKTVELTPDPQDQLDEAEITLKVTGSMPSEIWNRFGTKVLPMLREHRDLHIEINLSSTVNSTSAQHKQSDIKRALEELELHERIKVNSE